MRRVKPSVFLVGQTELCRSGMSAYLNHIGASDWRTDANTDAETLMEFMGRLCYRSWKPGMNANVTKVREGSQSYLSNIIKVKHGSVLEHAVTSWVFADVSRVFTHELVRHRAGAAYSQESLRFVRLTDLGLWLPPEAESQPWLVELFERTFKNLEELQKEMAKRLGLDDDGVQFKEKKVLTSLMRRAAPDGLATTIGASFNFRALRHIIEMRTAESAETEIRVVFDDVAKICKSYWPNVFSDFTKNDKGEWVTENGKI
jgi:thymidylate synthase (FAD)